MRASELLLPSTFAESVSNGEFQRPPHIRLIEREVFQVLFSDHWDVLVAMCPPRHGKTFYLARWFPTWYFGVYAERNIILTSYGKDLARTSSRWVKDATHKYAPIWNREGVNRLVSAATDWQTVEGGGMLAAGIGGGITGRPANIFLIDDVLKNAEQATSSTVRDNQWEWFQSCLPEGSPVMMASGEWRNIETIKPGERVAAFENNKIVATHVVANGDSPIGPTLIVDTEYGSLEVTGEHPFYRLPVKKAGKWLALTRGEWIAARDIKPGDRVLMTLKGTGKKRKRVPGKREYLEEDWWWLVGFIYGDGFVSDFRVSISLGNDDELNKKLGRLCDRFFGKHVIIRRGREHTMRVYSKKAADSLAEYGLVRCLTSKTKRLPPIIYQQRFKSRKAFLKGFIDADGYRKTDKRAIIALANKGLVEDLRLLAISSGYICGQVKTYNFDAQPPGSPNPLKATKYSLHVRDKGQRFYAARVRSVKWNPIHVKTYNLETGTGNFIANGFVVHNTALTRLEPGGKIIVLATRWHSEDLLGKILKFAQEGSDEHRLRVREIRLPALAEPTALTPDPLGRATDEALWPERYSTDRLKRLRASMDDYWFSAIFQQRLGTYGKNEWPEEYFWGIIAQDDEWPEHFDLLTTAVDPSKGKESRNGDYQAIVSCGYKNGYLWFDADVERRPIPTFVEELVQWNIERRPMVTGIESTQFQELLADSYRLAQAKYNYFDDPELIENTVAKNLRISRIGLWLRYHKVKIRNTQHGRLLIKQLKEFPNSDHDDGPDAMEMSIRLMLRLSEELQSISSDGEFNLTT